MPKVRWNGTDPFQDNRNDRVVKPGEVVVLKESVIGNHPHFEFVEEAEEPEADPVGELAETHWATVASEIEQGDHDELLDELEERDDRESVLEAIESRQAELEG